MNGNLAQPSAAPLGRLLAHRGIEASALARMAEVSVLELDAVLAGSEVRPALVWRLAPALGLHAADLFVIAQLDLPDELAAATGTVSWNAGQLMSDASRLLPELRERLHDFIRSLPLVPPAGPSRPASSYPPGPATTLLRLLENRNIHPWNARLLCVVGDGPYVSNSTVKGVCHGRFALTPHYVTAFANVLGIRTGDLAALTGVGPPVETGHPPHPQRAKLAALGWDARRLTSDQLRQAMNFAHDLWQADPRTWCYMCRSYHGPERVPTEAPPDVTWQRVAARMVPVSASAGPHTVVGGTASGYEHSMVGALVAAAHLSARASASAGHASWEPTLSRQFVPSSDRDALLETLQTGSDGLREPDNFSIPAGGLLRSRLGGHVEPRMQVGIQIARASSVNAAATRSAGGASCPSS
ncbi:hypothetical protein [Plantactinospora soyae]|uniref:DUF8175 domain-containing protein n=1 Tax=Plantactinospora soyae TaxID=1544732 RepID=A0A927QYH1_9ACTN|nr:hypothetical protein [Plantactinospora soyae]MBE1489210.1 hypothetical protein [Plantactinospora soyae]